jgi:transaldolase
MPNALEQLRKFTTIVIDSSDIDVLADYKPQDATTNPTLVLQAAQKEEYRPIITEAISFAKKNCPANADLESFTLDSILCAFGAKILSIVPGRVSTEVDAKISFDTEASIARAKQILSIYKMHGIDKSRVLIKLASTWEGILAAKELEKEQIHCNMTLMFSLPQAIGAANSQATLISPFVGRILDWYKTNEHFNGTPAQDPGVLSVREIYNFYKERGVKTVVMGASFRNSGEILELAGCDLLTISPKLLKELTNLQETVTRKLTPPEQPTQSLEPIDEKTFRWEFNENRMATEKLSDGIRVFAADANKLLELIKKW